MSERRYICRELRKTYFCDVQLYTIVERFDSVDLNSKLHKKVFEKMPNHKP